MTRTINLRGFGAIGMILAQDLQNPSLWDDYKDVPVYIARKGQIITPQIIKSANFWGVDHVDVVEEDQ